MTVAVRADTPDILKRILRRKLEEIAERSAQVSLQALMERIDTVPARGMRAAGDPQGFHHRSLSGV